MEIPRRYRYSVRGLPGRCLLPRGNQPPPALWVYVDLRSGGFSRAPAWGQHSRLLPLSCSAAPQPQVPLLHGYRMVTAAPFHLPRHTHCRGFPGHGHTLGIPKGVKP